MSTPSFPPLRRRPARVVPAVLVSLLALGTAGFLAWAAVLRFSRGSWPEPVASGAPAVLETPVTDPGVLAAGIVLGALGLVLLLCALVPGRHRSARLHVPAHLYNGSEETVLTHRGLGRLLETRTGRVDGVGRVRATVSDRRVRLHVDTPLRSTGGLRRRVRTVAEDAFVRLPLTTTPKLSVTVTEKRS